MTQAEKLQAELAALQKSVAKGSNEGEFKCWLIPENECVCVCLCMCSSSSKKVVVIVIVVVDVVFVRQ